MIINYPVTFNNVSFDTVPGLSVLAVDPYRFPRRNVSMTEIANTDKSKINSAFYSGREIEVKVGIVRDNRALLEQSVDTLKKILQPIDKELVLPQSNSRRKYYATFKESTTRQDGGSYIEFELTFECSDRFGYELASTLLLQITNFTSHNRTDPLNFEGSALWQVPVITLTYSSITSGTAKRVVIGNSSTGQAITITRTWVAGDVLVVDCFNKTVKVNGVSVDFSGAIPEWNVGNQYWYYDDNFSARTFSGQINYVKRYA